MPRRDQSDPFVELLDRARADQAIAERARERSLREQAAEGATFAGVLVDLAEHAAPVTLRTVAGRTHRATVAAVGADVVMLRTAAGEDVLVRLGAVATVRARPGGRLHAAGRDRKPRGARLLEVLSTLAPERPRVSVVTTGSVDPVRGDLVAVGTDVVTLRLEGDAALCAIRASAITEIAVVPAG